MMKKRVLSLFLVLCLVLTLGGCSVDFQGYLENLKMVVGHIVDAGVDDTMRFQDMTYTRPDMTEYRSTVEESCRIARESGELGQVEKAIWAVYDGYDSFYTNLSLANIHYCADLTDLYWSEEYEYCSSHSADADSGLDALYSALAASPIRATLEGDDYFGADFFTAYEGESIYDENLLEMMNRESALVSEYYDLSSQALETEYYSDDYFETYGTQMGQVYIQLVALRQEMAAYLGYDSYPQFAYDFYYSRDYTPEQALAYTAQIRETLVPLYQQMDAKGIWSDLLSRPYGEQDAYSYVSSAAQAMGGSVAQSFQTLEQRELYDISFGADKYDASFETYLYTYEAPYVFTCPEGTAYDPLSFAHEFGHFTSDYVCNGSGAGTDVAEFFSQGMEYLSLCYGDGDENVKKLKLLDCLSTYVEQAAYASFEQQVYGLTGEDLTVENVQALYARTGADFGFENGYWDSRDYVTVTHFFTSPMYVISYVVSNDAAFQLYQLEQAEPGSGLKLYEENLDSEQTEFSPFMTAAGLRSPFDPDRLPAVLDALTQALS